MNANKVKLDSIVIKGSKLLARAATSDYVDDAVYYISKSYFYQREWYQSQKKAEELIKNFPESQWMPDAHLVLAMDQLHQGNPQGALTTLSRTIDVAWAYERLDVLVDAFRLNADIHLAQPPVGNPILAHPLGFVELALGLAVTPLLIGAWREHFDHQLRRTGQMAGFVQQHSQPLMADPGHIGGNVVGVAKEDAGVDARLT